LEVSIPLLHAGRAKPGGHSSQSPVIWWQRNPRGHLQISRHLLPYRFGRHTARLYQQEINMCKPN